MSTSTRTVLVLDDDTADRTSIRRALSQAHPESYRVVDADDVAAGLRCIDEQPVHIVLLNLSRSGKRCLEPLFEIQAHAPHLPIIVLSGVNDQELATEAVRHGAQDYLVKGHINDAVILRVIRYAEERNKILSRLRGLDALKSQFVSTVSHEIRTPLAIIREFISLVRDEVVGPTTAQQQECLASATRNCDRLTTLVNDLLDGSRLDSGAATLRRVRTEPRALMQRCIDDFRPTTAGKQQELALDLPHVLPPVLCDPDRVQQVLVNLLGNAHKFTPTGGTITARARFDDSFVRIEIEDNGPGIGPKDRQRIFDAFAQVDRNDESGTTGSGLGLAISKGIVDLHGGTIEVESAPAAGSLFSFTLPRYEDGAEFDVFVEDRMRLIDDRSRNVSLALFRCTEPITSDLSPLLELQRCADGVLRNHGDETLLVESQGLLVCLLDSDTSGSLVALKRVCSTLSERGFRLDSIEYVLMDIDSARDWQKRLDAYHATFCALQTVLAPPSRQRVLVVDDDDMMLRLMEDIIERQLPDVEVVTTTSGYEACILYGGVRPDVVILDLQIPDVDGEEVLTSLLAASNDATRFLVVSSQKRRFPRMLELGCDECLHKPFDECDLSSSLRRLLQNAPAAQEPAISSL